jgi:hypothetical protein
MRGDHLDGRSTPVDVSHRFLKLAADACRPFGFCVEPCHSLFEELPKRLAGMHACSGRLLLMGVTFMNYAPERVCRLLSSLIRPGDAAVIAVELLRDGFLQSVMQPYRSEQAEAFNFLPLEILGVQASSVEYFVRFERNRIEMGFEALGKVNIGAVQLEPGSRLVTSFSYRYRIQELRALLEYHSPRRNVLGFRTELRGCTHIPQSELAGCNTLCEHCHRNCNCQRISNLPGLTGGNMLDLIGAAKIATDLLEFFAALTNKREIAKYLSACWLAALSVYALANNCIVIHQQDRDFIQAIHQGRDTAGKDPFANWLLKERLSGDIGSGLLCRGPEASADPETERLTSLAFARGKGMYRQLSTCCRALLAGIGCAT